MNGGQGHESTPFSRRTCHTARVQDSCDNCGRATTWEKVFDSQKDLYRCAQCGSWSYFGEVLESAEEIYGEDYFSGGEYAGYVEGEQAFRQNFKRMGQLLEARGRKFRDMRLLEIGSATGVFLEVAKERGVISALGIEASEYCRKQAKAKGIELMPPGEPATLAAVAEQKPNCLVAWDVWEHLRHPAAQMDEYLEHCADDVVVAITTVDASSLVARWRGPRWRQFHPPTHLHYPTREGIRHYFESRDFSIAVHHSFGYYRPLMAYVKALGVNLGKRFGKLRELPIYLDLWDIQMLIAKRGNSRGRARS